MVKLRLIALGLVTGALLAAGLAFGVTEASATGGSPQPRVQPDPAQSIPGEFVGIPPVRVLDTRVPIGVPTKAKLGPDQTIDVAISGEGGVPSNATAVAINITSAGATAPSYLTVYPTGSSRPVSSVANVTPSLSLAGSGSFDLGTGGQLTVFNAAGSTNVVIDVSGYYLANPVPENYTWNPTLDGTPPFDVAGSTTFPAGSTVTINSASWEGSFSCPNSSPDFAGYVTLYVGSQVLVQWQNLLLNSAGPTVTNSPLVLTSAGSLSATVGCPPVDTGGTTTGSVNVSFTVEPPPAPALPYS